MPVEMGNLTQLAFIQELVFGTTPAAPVGQLLRYTGCSMSPERNFIDNPEFRTDRMKPAGRGGALRGKDSIEGLLSYGTYDAFFAAVLGCYDWLANVIKIKPLNTSGTVSVTIAAAGKTFTRGTGDFTTNFAVDDYVEWSGFTNAANNIVGKITTLTSTVMTIAGATGLVNEGPVNAVCITAVRPSFTLERGHKANGIYFAHLGCVVDSFELSGKINEAVSVKFELLAKSVSNEAAASVFSSLTAVNTNDLITSWEGSISKGGAAIANVVGWTLKGTANCDTAEVCGNSALYDIQPGKVEISGSIELYFNSVALYTDMRAESDVTFALVLGPGGTKSYQIDLTKCRIKS